MRGMGNEGNRLNVGSIGANDTRFCLSRSSPIMKTQNLNRKPVGEFYSPTVETKGALTTSKLACAKLTKFKRWASFAFARAASVTINWDRRLNDR